MWISLDENWAMKQEATAVMTMEMNNEMISGQS